MKNRLAARAVLVLLILSAVWKGQSAQAQNSDDAAWRSDLAAWRSQQEHDNASDSEPPALAGS